MDKKNYYIEINKETHEAESVYLEELHGAEFCKSILTNGGIVISEELWRAVFSKYPLVKVDVKKLSAIPQIIPEGRQHFCFDLEHCNCFSEYKPPLEDWMMESPVNEFDVLKEEMTELKKLVEQLLNK